MITDILLDFLTKLTLKAIGYFPHSIFNIPILSAVIGALGSVLGGIIGALVAFKIASDQLKIDRTEKSMQQTITLNRFKKLVLNEINDNQLFLSEIKQESNPLYINSIVKFSLSSTIFSSIITELNVDAFYKELNDYYKILYRIQNDDTLLDPENLDTLIKEINYLTEVHENLVSLNS